MRIDREFLEASLISRPRSGNVIFWMRAWHDHLLVQSYYYSVYTECDAECMYMRRPCRWIDPYFGFTVEQRQLDS